MPTIALTQRAVDALKAPASGRVEYFDRVLPGFGLRIAAGGRKTWFVMYRVRGKKVRETLGILPLIPKVEKARDLARGSPQQAQAGLHPVEQRRAAKRQAAEKPNSFRAVAELYIERYASKNTKPATWRESRANLKSSSALPSAWARMSASSFYLVMVYMPTWARLAVRSPAKPTVMQSGSPPTILSPGSVLWIPWRFWMKSSVWFPATNFRG